MSDSKKDTGDKNSKSKVVYDYGEDIGTIELVNISETFEEPLLLAVACFSPDTKVKMENGDTKPISDLLVGDKVYKGGAVYMTMQSLSNDVYDLSGTLVAGGHTVYREGRWLQVKDCPEARRLEGHFLICNIGTQEHMLVLENGDVFADFYLTDQHVDLEKGLIEIMNREKSESLKLA